MGHCAIDLEQYLRFWKFKSNDKPTLLREMVSKLRKISTAIADEPIKGTEDWDTANEIESLIRKLRIMIIAQDRDHSDVSDVRDKIREETGLSWYGWGKETLEKIVKRLYLIKERYKEQEVESILEKKGLKSLFNP